MSKAEQKKLRHTQLQEQLKHNPFLKDEELAKKLHVSVATIRLDRAELGIREYRERVKTVADKGLKKSSAVRTGDLLDLNLYHDGLSVMVADESMAVAGTDIIKITVMHISFMD